MFYNKKSAKMSLSHLAKIRNTRRTYFLLYVVRIGNNFKLQIKS